ncbi:MAG: hypothetical protein ACFFAY_16030, partial [Promethearchaeota archaeon]
MAKRSISFILVLLMMSPAFLLYWTTSERAMTSTQGITQKPSFDKAETDLARVDWTDNMFPNKGFETWSNPVFPSGLSTYRTTEEATWIETGVVNQGSQSMGMHARAIDSIHWSEVKVSQTSQPTWDNPINTTLSFDWYMDSIGTPIDSDYFMLAIKLSWHNMYYYIGCERTTVANGTMSAYFMIDGPLQSWNSLYRNLTADYIEAFGGSPDLFNTMEWFVRSNTNVHTRVFMDDVILLNDTDVMITNGNFENGKNGWYTTTSTDPSDISRSALAYHGDWSMNMTAISYDYVSYGRTTANVGKLLNEDNQGQFSFWWRINEWVNNSEMTYARIEVDTKNATHSFTIYYYLCYGGSGVLPPLIFGNDMQFKADGFNTSGTWHLFDRNVWADFNSYYSTENLYIDQITFYVRANEDDSRLSILFDDVALETSIINDVN